MFRSTLIGHHCWLFSTETTRLLVDPLLDARFGLTPAVELRVYPPRVTGLSAFPAIDAIFLTHEHEGHVDLPSLNRIDRGVPVYLSARSSIATRRILAEMGFTVHLANPGERIAIGDLSLLPMTADQVNDGVIEEWDLLAYLVWDGAGHGSFFSSVDMRATDAMVTLARTVVGGPGLWAHTTNASVCDFALAWDVPRDRSLHEFVHGAFERHRAIADAWTAPAALLVVGGGWAFGGDQSWINTNHFPFENDEAAAALAPMLPGERVLAPLPGTTIVMKDGRVHEIEAATPFVRAAPKKEWPSRKLLRDVELLETYTPASGRTDIGEDGAALLQNELESFATHLYSSDLFRRLHSLTKEDLRGREPTFAFLLKVDASDGAFVVAYDPRSCSFASVACEDPVATYLAVFECWATDLLAFLRAELSPTTLSFGRHREWNANPDAFRFSLEARLFEYTHQLRQPQRHLALYRSILRALPRSPHAIAYAGAPR